MAAWILAAWVAGNFLAQQQSTLPASRLSFALGALGLLAAIAACLAARRAGNIATESDESQTRSRLQGRRRRQALAASFALGITASVATAFVYASLAAQIRLADELAFDDEGRDLRVTGTIASLPAQLERGSRFEFAVEEVDGGVHVPARIALSWYASDAGDANVRAGQRWQFTVRLRRPHGTFNPGGFDLEAWLLERNVRASGYVRAGRATASAVAAGTFAAPLLIDDLVWRPDLLVDRARDALRERLQQRLQDRRYGGVLLALVLGDQRAISEPDWQLFNRTGISHLVSISGLHITMIAGLAALAAAFFWRRSRWLVRAVSRPTIAALAALFAALLYCLLAGWGVPAQRTFFMLGTVALALLIRTASGPATTLALAAAVVCLIDPWAVIAAGFWLSFGAVAAIFWVTSGRVARPSENWRDKLGIAVRVQAAVTLALLPMTLVLFQQVSLISPLANAVAIPLVSFVVTPLALIAAVSTVLPEPLSFLAGPLLAAAHGLFDLLAQGLSIIVQWPGASVPLPAPPPWTLLGAGAGVLWLLAPPGWPARWLGAIWLLPLVIWPVARPHADELWVTAFDVGQGMALLVETERHVVLYDTGPRYSPEADAGSRVIVPYLRWRGIDHIDLLVVSHLDIDHSGGTPAVLANVPVAEALSSIDPQHALVRGARNLDRCRAGQQRRFDAATLRVLRPLASDYARPRMSTNAISCVVAIELGAVRVLLTGDLPAREEAELAARVSDLETTLLVAPHHGSHSSSSPEFLAATGPRWVVFQAGYRNRFGHPAADVIERYQLLDARMRRTDFDGAVRSRSRPGARSIGAIGTTSRQARRAGWASRTLKKRPVNATCKSRLNRYRKRQTSRSSRPRLSRGVAWGKLGDCASRRRDHVSRIRPASC